MVKVEKKSKKDEKPLICYKHGGHGHTSRNCPRKAFVCRISKSTGYCGSRQPVRQPLCCEGFVEGQFNDIVLGIDFSRTLVRSGLMREKVVV